MKALAGVNTRHSGDSRARTPVNLTCSAVDRRLWRMTLSKGHAQSQHPGTWRIYADFGSLPDRARGHALVLLARIHTAIERRWVCCSECLLQERRPLIRIETGPGLQQDRGLAKEGSQY